MSQQMTVRSSIAAFSIGTSSSSRLRAMTKPPVCWLRWRGKPISSTASSSARRSRGSAGSSPASRTWPSSSPFMLQPQTEPDRAPIMSSDRPIALPTSRTAARVR